MQTSDRSAPGGPGIPARWTSSAKTGVGTALSDKSHVWFTLILAIPWGFSKGDADLGGYPWLVHRLTYRRANRNLHVRGYKEEGTITIDV